MRVLGRCLYLQMAGLAIYRWSPARPPSVPTHIHIIIIYNWSPAPFSKTEPLPVQPSTARAATPRAATSVPRELCQKSTVRTLLIQIQHGNQVTYRRTSTQRHQKKKVNKSLKKRNKRTTPPILRAVTAPFSKARQWNSATTESSLPRGLRGTGAKRKRVRKRSGKTPRHQERHQERHQTHQPGRAQPQKNIKKRLKKSLC